MTGVSTLVGSYLMAILPRMKKGVATVHGEAVTS